jgi:chromosome segregation ATPase
MGQDHHQKNRQPVMDHQPREKNQQGHYVHTQCAKWQMFGGGLKQVAHRAAENLGNPKQSADTKDQGASELDTQSSCCKEELTMYQSDLAKANSETHTAKNELTDDNKEKKLTTDQKDPMPELDTVRGNEKELGLRMVLMEKVHAELANQINNLAEELGEAETRLQDSQETILMKENCIKTLMDENKEMQRVVDAQRKEIEKSQETILVKENCINTLMDENKEMQRVVDAQRKEIEILLAASQEDYKEKEKCIKDKETLTKERDDSNKAQRELVKQLIIWTNELDDVTKLQAAKDKEAAEMYKQFHCCNEELTRCQRDLAQATLKNHTAKNELTAELYALRKRMVLMEEHQCNLARSLEESKLDNREKEKCIKELKELTVELETTCGNTKEMTAELDAYRQNNALVEEHNKEMKRVVDAQQQEIKIVLATSQRDNMEKEKRITELTIERDASRGNAKKLTAELGALSERIAVMEKHNYDLFKSLEEAKIRLEETKTRQFGEIEVHQGASLNA